MSEIRLEKLHREFKEVVAVHDVTITFPTSTVTCLLGPSGCGKTTLMRIIAGLETPTSGDIYFDDERVTHLSPSQRNIGMVFQYPVVYRGINVYRNIELPLLKEIPFSGERRYRIEEVAEILGLQDCLNQDISELDNGTRQKVAVARAVVRQPRIILFDEPITNVDINSKVQLKKALRQLTRKLNQTIVYVTHDQTEAMTLADQIVLMKAGRIVQCDAPRALYNRPNDTFGGWFLGNPGMNFFEVAVETSGDHAKLASVLFALPTTATGLPSDIQQVTLGIRPEHISVGYEPTAASVAGRIVRRAIVVGGQYLLTVQVGDRVVKVKVPSNRDYQVQDNVWIECQLEQITVFGSDGHRLDATLAAQDHQPIQIEKLRTR
jgi:ABC-type sugar transport system ATPase subunit